MMLCYLCQQILQGCRYRDRPRLRVQPLLEDRLTSRRTPPTELHSRSHPPDSDARRRQRHQHDIPRQRCMEWKLPRLADCQGTYLMGGRPLKFSTTLPRGGGHDHLIRESIPLPPVRAFGR
jgi:hypothetical protein